ncbi:MAG: prepilin-type N-terminal cleavage/methylation domain-containing protein [Chthoniobacter sp.]
MSLAIGIISFAIVALLGALPLGLTLSEAAVRQTVHTHILQRISSDLEMLPFADLDSYVAAEQYYNWEGQSVTAPDDAIFVVKLERLAPDYPGSEALQNLDSVMDRVTVETRRVGQPETAATRDDSDDREFRSMTLPDRSAPPACRIRSAGRQTGFTLVEVMVACVILSMILVLMLSVVNQVSGLWKSSSSRVDAFRNARLAFEDMERLLSQACLNTYWDYDNTNAPQRYIRKSELHFLVDDAGTVLGNGQNFSGQAVFFQTPAVYSRPDGDPQLNAGTDVYGGLPGLLNALRVLCRVCFGQGQGLAAAARVHPRAEKIPPHAVDAEHAGSLRLPDAAGGKGAGLDYRGRSQGCPARGGKCHCPRGLAQGAGKADPALPARCLLLRFAGQRQCRSSAGLRPSVATDAAGGHDRH